MKEKKNSSQINKILPFLFLGIGILIRVWKFGAVPADINVDEAFSGYEAYSLLHYGVDSQGYAFPVYLNAWGSGMNVLPSLLMIPFLAVFGLKTWVIRLPHLLVGCITLWVVYRLIEKLMNRKAALFVLFFLAICPWHIMISRWALESNMVVGFLTFGLYFFVCGLEKPKYLMLSALMYGLALYCYATIWPFLPFMLLVQIGYCIWTKKLRFTKEAVWAVVILGVMALPLMMFLMVNYGLMNEIRTPVFSIPKLVQMRTSEFTLNGLPEKMRRLWRIIKVQEDYIPGNFAGKYGIYYKCSFPFFLLGLIFSVGEWVKGLVKKEFNGQFFWLLQMAVAGVLSILVYINITRVNILMIPMVVVTAYGMYRLCECIHPKLFVVPFVIYLLFFAGFSRYYFTEYADELAYSYCRGVGEAITEAARNAITIRVCPGISYVRVLFYAKEPVTEFRDTVKYINFPSTFLEAESFGRFEFQFDKEHPTLDAVYVLDRSVDWKIYLEAGFDTIEYEDFAVAIPRE